MRRLLRLTVCAVVAAAAAAIAFVWWLPMPNELQKSPNGTLTLLDYRGREIAELASPESVGRYDNGESFMGTCPDCGSQLEYAEGCVKCHVCGFSECG